MKKRNVKKNNSKKTPKYGRNIYGETCIVKEVTIQKETAFEQYMEIIKDVEAHEAKGIRIEYANGRIIMDRTFAKCAEDTRSEEYRHLQSVRQDYPTYTVVRKQIKKPAHKESYKGLTYDYMRTYITNHEPKETKDAVSKEFEDMIEISKCHSIRYPTIKKWFLAKYPEVAGFGVAVEKAESEAESKSEDVKQNNVTHLPQPAQEEAEYDKVENF